MLWQDESKFTREKMTTASEGKISLGIDIGGTSVKAAAMQNDQTLWTGQSPFYSKPTTDELRGAIAAAVSGRLTPFDAVGLCVPGLLDDATRMVTFAVNVPGVVGHPLDWLVPHALGQNRQPPTKILNDAGATAIDLLHLRKFKGRLLVLTLGTGVGAAVLDEGKPLFIDEGSPGHLGQIDVSIPGADVIGPDGGAGGLEGYIGVAGIQRRYGSDVSAIIAEFTGEEPPIAALVRAIRIAHAIYRPQHICLAGGIGIRLGHLLPVMRAKIESHLTSVARRDWTLGVGDDDFHAARGAARSAAEILL
jgi:predicted NBD/HSP70 family sugar kinase